MEEKRHIEMEKELRRALDNGEFLLYYQPKVDLVTGKIVQTEALIRWEHPEKGMISPVEFIPEAEETGMLESIGEWVLRTACKQCVKWQEVGLNSLVMAVNLSVCQLHNPNFVETVKNILAETKLCSEYLELEITESMTSDVKNIIPILHNLKNIGIKISLDDFGTGYSSLYHLKEFPIDTLKIDKSFVRTCTTNPKDGTIVKTIIAMAHQMNLEVIGEGVETKGHLIFLQENLCNHAQGFLFSKPLSPEEFVQSFSEIESILSKEGIEPDFNRQKWLERELEEARQELKETIRQQQGMIFKFIKDNSKWVHILCDGELLYRMNFTPEDIIGKDLDRLLPEKELKRVAKHYDLAWSGEENVTFEGEINGIAYLTSLRPIKKNKKVISVIGSSIDISERKRIEESLRLSELKYRLIAENSQDLICVMDREGMIQYVSPSIHTFLGLSPEMFEGLDAFEWMHPQDKVQVKEKVAEILTKKIPSQTIPYRNTNKNGEWMQLEARATPVLDENGEVEYVVVISRVLFEEQQEE